MISFASSLTENDYKHVCVMMLHIWLELSVLLTPTGPHLKVY